MENVKVVNTAKKYEGMEETIVPILFELLRERLALDEEMYEKTEKLEAEFEAKKDPNSISHLDLKPIWKEYNDRLTALIDGRVSEELKSRTRACALGDPDYYYMNGEFAAEFTMRRADTATIVTTFKEISNRIPDCNRNADGIGKHKFSMRLVDGKWILDNVFDWRFERWRKTAAGFTVL